MSTKYFYSFSDTKYDDKRVSMSSKPYEARRVSNPDVKIFSIRDTLIGHDIIFRSSIFYYTTSSTHINYQLSKSDNQGCQLPTQSYTKREAIDAVPMYP